MLNLTTNLIAAIIPLIIGFIYYHPKVFGNTWMRLSGMTEEKMKSGNIAVIFILAYVFSLMLAVSLNFIVIHQNHLYSIVQNQPDFMNPASEAGSMVKAFMDKYGTNFRTFKHGALHGTIAAIFFALPIFGINALFERKGAKYIFVHLGFWVITLLLMGGFICQYA